MIYFPISLYTRPIRSRLVDLCSFKVLHVWLWERVWAVNV